jgi:hypothetical protein
MYNEITRYARKGGAMRRIRAITTVLVAFLTCACTGTAQTIALKVEAITYEYPAPEVQDQLNELRDELRKSEAVGNKAEAEQLRESIARLESRSQSSADMYVYGIAVHHDGQLNAAAIQIPPRRRTLRQNITRGTILQVEGIERRSPYDEHLIISGFQRISVVVPDVPWPSDELVPRFWEDSVSDLTEKSGILLAARDSRIDKWTGYSVTGSVTVQARREQNDWVYHATIPVINSGPSDIAVARLVFYFLDGYDRLVHVDRATVNDLRTEKMRVVEVKTPVQLNHARRVRIGVSYLEQEESQIQTAP